MLLFLGGDSVLVVTEETPLLFSNHAYDRLVERLDPPDDWVIPYEKILKPHLGANVEPGHRIETRLKRIIFVMKVLQNSLLVLTALPNHAWERKKRLKRVRRQQSLNKKCNTKKDRRLRKNAV